jgi:hypothetical protein
MAVDRRPVDQPGKLQQRRGRARLRPREKLLLTNPTPCHCRLPHQSTASNQTAPRRRKTPPAHRSNKEAWALFPGDVAYVWHAGVHARTVIESLEAAGFAIRSQIVWAKPRLVLGRGDHHWQHEWCLYAVRKGATGHWQGAREQTTL